MAHQPVDVETRGKRFLQEAQDLSGVTMALHGSVDMKQAMADHDALKGMGVHVFSNSTFRKGPNFRNPVIPVKTQPEELILTVGNSNRGLRFTRIQD